MFNVLLSRLKQGYRTIDFPKGEPEMPDRFQGLPAIEHHHCPRQCDACAKACPTGAIRVDETLGPHLDMGRCLFCGKCESICPSHAIRFTQGYRLSARTREDLVVNQRILALAGALDESMRKLFGRSLKLRQVSAGGCGACEADTNVLNTVGYDLGRFGIQFVASPRHADGLLVTGPVTENMKQALKKTYDAVPSPKIVIAVGACAISGGPYIDHPETHDGAGSVVPVDLYIPGCPPHPITILDGLLRLLGRI